MNNRKKLINRLKADVRVLEEYLIKRRPYSIKEKFFEEELIRDIILAIIELEKLAWQPLPEPYREEKK